MPATTALNETPTSNKARTGIAGLDQILRGGLPANRLYLLRGEPGVGKTTLALQFLMEGIAHGEPGLYITLSETRDEIRSVAESHGWNLDKLDMFEMSALEEQLARESQNTIFHPSELELNQTTEALLAEIRRVNPRRVALDSLSELRLLADTPLRYRRQMLAFKRFFAGREITVLLLDDHASDEGDAHVQSIAHGVIAIEQLQSDYGAERRRVRIEKLRGVDFAGGYHDATIVPGGLRVFPRLVAAEHRRDFGRSQLGSGVPALDALLGGGLDAGTSTLFMGPSGSGKSSVAIQFAIEAANHGRKPFVYLFEENERTLMERANSLGMPLADLAKAGKIVLRQIDPAELSPGEFVDLVRQNVETDGGGLVLIDSLNGYLQAMPDGRFLTLQLHELLTFLNHRGTISLLTLAQQGLVGTMSSPVDLTFLADTVLLLRYFEHGGAIRKAISVIKKRIGRHENAIREFRLDQHGLTVGKPLHDFEGVLSGVPSFVGKSSQMLSKE